MSKYLDKKALDDFLDGSAALTFALLSSWNCQNNWSHKALSTNLLNFSPKASMASQKFYWQLETGKGNKVKAVVCLRRILHSPAIVRLGPSDLCGQNFEGHRSQLSSLPNNMLNFSPKARQARSFIWNWNWTEKGNEVETMVWLRRISHFLACDIGRLSNPPMWGGCFRRLHISQPLLDKGPLIYVVAISKDRDNKDLSNNLLNLPFKTWNYYTLLLEQGPCDIPFPVPSHC